MASTDVARPTRQAERWNPMKPVWHLAYFAVVCAATSAHLSLSLSLPLSYYTEEVQDASVKRASAGGRRPYGAGLICAIRRLWRPLCPDRGSRLGQRETETETERECVSHMRHQEALETPLSRQRGPCLGLGFRVRPPALALLRPPAPYALLSERLSSAGCDGTRTSTSRDECVGMPGGRPTPSAHSVIDSDYTQHSALSTRHIRRCDETQQ